MIDRQRLTQLCLRTLLLATTAICIGLAAFSNWAGKRYRAVEAVLNLGGAAWYPDKGYCFSGPDWKRVTHVGRWPWEVWADSLPSVLQVDLADTAADDATCRALASLSELEWLDLSRTRITDAGTEGLSSLQYLIALDLSGTSVGDTSVRALVVLKNLSYLSLDGTAISDEGVGYLSDMENLLELSLKDVEVDDGLVEALRRMLPGCRIQRW